MSPFSAVSVLHAFNKDAGLNLSQEVFDTAVDALVALLEKSNDNKHRVYPVISDVKEK